MGTLGGDLEQSHCSALFPQEGHLAAGGERPT